MRAKNILSEKATGAQSPNLLNQQVIYNETGIPAPVLVNMVRAGQVPFIRLAELPAATLPTSTTLDERLCCGFARRDDPEGAAACHNLAQDSGGGTWCRLNGRERRSPCVFAEPEEARIWIDIREQQRIAAEIERDKAKKRVQEIEAELRVVGKLISALEELDPSTGSGEEPADDET
jgi:hypothetical protein